MTAADPITTGRLVDGLFAVEGELLRLTPLGDGHIHQTWLAVHRRPSGSLERLVYQRVNAGVFSDPHRLSANVARVAAHLAGREAPTPVPAAGGGPVAVDAEGGVWRAWHFVPGRTVHRFDHPGQARAAGAAFARLAARLADLPGPPLVEPIPGFHDFTRRLAAFETAVAEDIEGRAASCRAEIEHVRGVASLVAELDRGRADGLLPPRLVHNDAKAENVLFDEAGTEVRAVLDLDTVAPGTVLFDVGDLIRSGAATRAEDGNPAPGRGPRSAVEGDVDVEIAVAVVEGYVDAVPGLVGDRERSLLPLAGPLMAFEAGMRFLADHLAGDVYFRIDAPGHNLARARNQLRLVDCLIELRPRLAEMLA